MFKQKKRLSLTKQLNGKTKGDGGHFLKILFYGSPIFSQSLIIEATSQVTDLNSKQIKQNQQFFVHPCPLYLGIKSTTSSIKEPVVEITMVVSNIGIFLKKNLKF